MKYDLIVSDYDGTLIKKNGEISDELHKYDTKGELIKWTRLKKIIEALGFKVEDKTLRINGKRTRVSIISE